MSRRPSAKGTDTEYDYADDAAEARKIRDVIRNSKEIAAAWADMLSGAAENYRRQGKTEPVAAAKSDNPEATEEARQMERAAENATLEEAEKDMRRIMNGDVRPGMYIPLAKSTPFAVRYVTGIKDDHPIAAEEKKLYFDLMSEGKYPEDASHHYHGLGVDGYLDVMRILEDPDYAIEEYYKNGTHYAFIKENRDTGEEKCVAFEMERYLYRQKSGAETGQFYNIDITEFITSDEWRRKNHLSPDEVYHEYLIDKKGFTMLYNKQIDEGKMIEAQSVEVGSAANSASRIERSASEVSLTYKSNSVNRKMTRVTAEEDARYLELAKDPVTYDDAGNVIPLSERFNREKEDIRYCTREEVSSIKEQIASAADTLNSMAIVTAITTKGFHGKRNSEIAAIVANEFKTIGNKVDRKNFGEVLLAYAQINKALNYLNTDAEKAALLAVPKVIKRGITVESHDEHKNRRNVSSVTFAAPVEINGVRGNEGVVVQNITGINRFKTLRILTPDGRAFELSTKIETDPTTGGKPAKTAGGTPIGSASDLMVSQYDAGSQELFGKATLVANVDTSIIDEINDENAASAYEVRHSSRIEDRELLESLNRQIENGEYITVYRSFQIIDGGMYAPMNAVDRDGEQMPGHLAEYDVERAIQAQEQDWARLKEASK